MPKLDAPQKHRRGVSIQVTKLEAPKAHKRSVSTTQLVVNGDDFSRLLGNTEAGTTLLEKVCCGGECCVDGSKISGPCNLPVNVPQNAAFLSLNISVGALSLDTDLISTEALPEQNISFAALPMSDARSNHKSTVLTNPPEFVQPHPPYQPFNAKVQDARELSKAGAAKRTYHFELDVTDYPDGGGIDFKVGGAVGIMPANDTAVVNDIFDCLGVPSFVRDKPVLLRTSAGRWPTMWGEDEPREMVTTRRELLTWCTDLTSIHPTKAFLRVLAEHAKDSSEQKILMYLASNQGQGAYCDLRAGPPVTVAQLLHAFPSAQPPLPALFTVLKQLTPRFYSLSNDPHVSSIRNGTSGRRFIEMAVTAHAFDSWNGSEAKGLGSGYMERVANKIIDSKAAGTYESAPVHLSMFRGLMANPLSQQFVDNGPMVLIGVGVGVAPFRGMIMNRMRTSNCANKVWLIQGVRDSTVDELYAGEMGDHEMDIKRVVQSRKQQPTPGESRYVQDEVRQQADVVWDVINAHDGRVFVCGNKGMGKGVFEALIDVAERKGGLNREEAEQFWLKKEQDQQYITVSHTHSPALQTTLLITTQETA